MPITVCNQPRKTDDHLYVGKFKQTTDLFHRISCNTTDKAVLNHFLMSQKRHQFVITKIGKVIVDAKPCRLWVLAKSYGTFWTLVSFV